MGTYERVSRLSLALAEPSPKKRKTRGWIFGGGALALALALPAISAASLASSTSSPTLAAAERAPKTEDVVTAAITSKPLTAPSARSACPRNMAQVGASCVDKYEASLVAIAEDGSEAAFSPYEAPNGKAVRAVSRPGVVPQAHISMVEAKRACAASGKRLCRAKEWTAACKGPTGSRYPYGDARVAGACVDTNRTSPMNRLYGGERSARTMNDPRANQQDGTVEKTGSIATCTNGYGVHDMVGNVHEWTDDGSFRGGYYLDTKLNGEGCEYRTTAHAPSYYDYSTGFRCCADAGSLADDET